ncbi:MAG: VWA domain-containing protein [Terriglobales bacterium]
MTTKIGAALIMGLTLLWAGWLTAQQNPENVPDAPSATRPIPPPSARAGAESQPDASTGESSSVTSGSTELPRSDSDSSVPPPPPMPPIKTVPAGSVPKDADTGQDIYTIRGYSTLVLVPVTVTDHDGHLIGGLRPDDFYVLEGGKRQPLKFFTSDPYALSAAVIFDTGMPDVGLKKVQETLSALQGAFSQFDEVAVYSYSSTVSQIADFSTVGQPLTVAMNEVKTFKGTNNGPPVVSGPLGPGGPIINGNQVDVPAPPVYTPPREARVLNDAILRAARDLTKRDKTRRKIIFIISDGRELNSTASYKDTLKVLLTQNITVYALGLESAGIPIYDRLQRIHLPKTTKLLGYSDILPKYVSATGGGTVLGEMTEASIERAYNQAIGGARNRYTLGYSPRAGIGGYREIEVRVRRSNVKVYAKAGYYPLPTPQ